MPNSTTIATALRRSAAQRIFLHEPQALETPEFNRLHTRHSFEERALHLARQGDIVLLGGAIETSYLDYLAELGIGPRRCDILVIDTDTDTGLTQRLATHNDWIEALRPVVDANRDLRVSPYYRTPQTEQIAQALSTAFGRPVGWDAGPPDVTRTANNKARMRSLAEDLEIPIAPGETVACTAGPSDVLGELRKAACRHLSLTGRVIVKAATANLEYDNIIVDEQALGLLPAWLRQRPHVTEYVVESLLPTKHSPNCTAWIHDAKSWETLGASQQRLDNNLQHTGNIFPFVLPPEVSKYATLILRRLAALGLRGPVGLDFIEGENVSGCPQHFFVEVNPRVNGSTYASAIWEGVNAQRRVHGLNTLASCSSIRSVDTTFSTFSQLRARAGELIYTHDRGCGVVPYNTAALAHHNISTVALAEDAATARALEQAFLRQING